MVGGARNLDGAERAQMLGDELGVEQAVMSSLEPGHQVDERDLRGITGAVEHALAEKGAPEANPVEAADQFVAVVNLDGVAVAALVKLCGRGCGSGC